MQESTDMVHNRPCDARQSSGDSRVKTLNAYGRNQVELVIKQASSTCKAGLLTTMTSLQSRTILRGKLFDRNIY